MTSETLKIHKKNISVLYLSRHIMEAWNSRNIITNKVKKKKDLKSELLLTLKLEFSLQKATGCKHRIT